ncbi:MAG: FAD-dependent monooxygenase [Sciscionella sp.]|nr:FAD-dependent monooxygenase [Sciscionella sp.]
MDYQAIVIGGGPVGLMTAGELALAGVFGAARLNPQSLGGNEQSRSHASLNRVRVLVVERLAEIDPTIKAGSINVPTIEAFYRRGMRAQVKHEQEKALGRITEFIRQRNPHAPPVTELPKRAGHFAGIMLDRDNIDDSSPEFARINEFADMVVIGQQEIEAILAKRAEELGAEIRRGVEFTALTSDDEGVTAIVDGQPIRASWLVGADGGRSAVRKLAGFDFPGTEPEITGHQAIVELTGAEGLRVGWNRTPRGIYVYGPTPGRILTVEFDGPPADRDAPITAAELQQSLRNVSGINVTITAVKSATRFTDNCRQVTNYRRGRILLAGDAAHVHTPFGGQGLNLGIGDAMNLGWKLAAEINGWAPPGLLDSYTAERHPIGEWVLDWSRAQVALMRTDWRTNALRDVVADLMRTADGAGYFVRKLSGVLHRYPIAGDHPLIGASAPDFELSTMDTTVRLGELLHDGRAVLLDLADNRALAELAAGWASRVNVVGAKCQVPDAPAGLLVRPDGFVAWASDDSSIGGLSDALHTWFGTPISAESVPELIA